jgi:hypothetical protein
LLGPVIVTSLCSTLLICARSSDTSCLQSIAIKAKVADLTRVLPGFLLFYLRGDLRLVVRYKLLLIERVRGRVACEDAVVKSYKS